MFDFGFEDSPFFNIRQYNKGVCFPVIDTGRTLKLIIQ